MPGGDGTGPMGLGPMTGRAAGYCAGYDVPGYMNPIPGRGGWGRGRGGWGRGGGRGFRNRFWATGMTGPQRAAMGMAPYGAGPYGMPPYPAFTPPTRDQQLEALKAQAQYFEDALSDIRKQMDDLKAEKTDA